LHGPVSLPLHACTGAALPTFNAYRSSWFTGLLHAVSRLHFLVYVYTPHRLRTAAVALRGYTRTRCVWCVWFITRFGVHLPARRWCDILPFLRPHALRVLVYARSLDTVRTDRCGCHCGRVRLLRTFLLLFAGFAVSLVRSGYGLPRCVVHGSTAFPIHFLSGSLHIVWLFTVRLVVHFTHIYIADVAERTHVRTHARFVAHLHVTHHVHLCVAWFTRCHCWFYSYRLHFFALCPVYAFILLPRSFGSRTTLRLHTHVSRLVARFVYTTFGPYRCSPVDTPTFCPYCHLPVPAFYCRATVPLRVRVCCAHGVCVYVRCAAHIVCVCARRCLHTRTHTAYTWFAHALRDTATHG